jgi:hypothetical protein
MDVGGCSDETISLPAENTPCTMRKNIDHTPGFCIAEVFVAPMIWGRRSRRVASWKN